MLYLTAKEKFPELRYLCRGVIKNYYNIGIVLVKLTYLTVMRICQQILEKVNDVKFLYELIVGSFYSPVTCEV